MASSFMIRGTGRSIAALVRMQRGMRVASVSRSIVVGSSLHSLPSLSQQRSPVTEFNPVGLYQVSGVNQRFFSSYPDHEVIGLPALSPTMENGTIGSWKVKEGESFSEGDVIAEIETDKATVDFQIQEEGVIAKILVPEGGEAKVGQPILVVVDSADKVAAFADFSVGESSASSPPEAPSTPVVPPAPTQSTPPPQPTQPAQITPTQAPQRSGDRVFASPFARKLARESGFDITAIPGTGPKGRIIAADVMSFQPSLSAATEQAQATPAQQPQPVVGAGFVDYPLSEQSRQAAANMVASKQQVPHYYLTVDIELTNLLAARDDINTILGEGDEVSVNDMLMKAAALATKTVPEVNSSWMESFVRAYDRCDINVVMGSGDSYVAPVIRDVASSGLKSISDQVKQFAAFAEEGSMAPENLATGTLTIVNLGMYGVKAASPVITMPQAAVLALGTIDERVLPNNKPDSDQIYRLAPVISVTGTFDHRVVDGAVGAQWLAAFKKLVENPISMLL